MGASDHDRGRERGPEHAGQLRRCMEKGCGSGQPDEIRSEVPHLLKNRRMVELFDVSVYYLNLPSGSFRHCGNDAEIQRGEGGDLLSRIFERAEFTVPRRENKRQFHNLITKQPSFYRR